MSGHDAASDFSPAQAQGIEEPDNGLLYTLDFECPFPWPQVPNYPISRGAAVNLNGNSMTLDAINGTASMPNSNGTVGEGSFHAPAASTSRVRLEEMQIAEHDHAPATNNDGSGPAAEEADKTILQAHGFPETLQEYYWDCLYYSAKPSKVSIMSLGSINHTCLTRNLAQHAPAYTQTIFSTVHAV